MKDIFGNNTIQINQFNLSKNNKSAPSFLWNKTNELIEDESFNQDEDYDKRKLWEVRYHKIG